MQSGGFLGRLLRPLLKLGLLLMKNTLTSLAKSESVIIPTLKITTGQRSLTFLTELVTCENLAGTVTMTTNT